jgi:MATE family multidrug resistance protein
VCHLIDASQGFGAGVLRAIGAQLYGSLMVFFSFYMLGIPIGIYLMFTTKLRVFGFWVGFLIAAAILLLLQIMFIVRVDWAKTAQAVIHRL